MGTLLEVFTSLFPNEARDLAFSQAPLLPADVFAYAAHVMERSGGYHHVAPEIPGLAASKFRKILVDESLRKRVARIGGEWRKSLPEEGERRLPSPPIEVEILWQRLGIHQDDLAKTLHSTSPPSGARSA
jgi:hypothetical protein